MVVRTLLGLCFYVLFFSNVDVYAGFFQVLGLLLFALAAFITIFTTKFSLGDISAIEGLLYVMVLQSFLASLFGANETALIYTAVFGVAFLSASVLARTVPIATLLGAISAAYLAIQITILVTDLESYSRSLAGEVTAASGLLRYRAFGLHPNLMGFVFGGGAIIAYWRSRIASSKIRMLFLASSALSFSLAWAASSRAALLALAFCILLQILALVMRRATNFILGLVLAFTTILSTLAIVAFYPGQQLTGYAERMLDLGDPQRGLGSGATGRTSAWAQSLIEVERRDLASAMLGTGFRSSSPEYIGYSTESSYFTILLENGTLLGIAFISLTVLRTAKFLYIGYRQNNAVALTLGYILLYALAQSVFNRYLLAAGNPYSLFLLLCFVIPAKLARGPASFEWTLKRSVKNNGWPYAPSG